MEEILSRHGLRATDLDKECPQGVRNEVAIKLDDWEMVGHYLEFPREKVRDINRENSTQDRCRITLLDTWGKREGKGATYLKLASALHCRQRCDLVELLCAKLKSLVPLSESVTSREVPPANGQQHQIQQYQNPGSSSTGTKRRNLMVTIARCCIWYEESEIRGLFSSSPTCKGSLRTSQISH